MPMAASATHKVQIEVMPLFAGHLPFPKIKVLKYLPHTAAVAIQPDPGKTLSPQLYLRFPAKQQLHAVLQQVKQGNVPMSFKQQV